MKKKPVDGYSKPGFFSKLFGKKGGNETPVIAGGIPAATEPENIPEDTLEEVEIVRLEGDVAAPIERPVKKHTKRPKDIKNPKLELRGKMIIPEEDDGK